MALAAYWDEQQFLGPTDEGVRALDGSVYGRSAYPSEFISTPELRRSLTLPARLRRADGHYGMNGGIERTGRLPKSTATIEAQSRLCVMPREERW